MTIEKLSTQFIIVLLNGVVLWSYILLLIHI